MRPVKKALKALDTPDMSLREDERVARARRCLYQIGNHISICLGEYKDPEQVDEWKGNLWYFASKFTNFKAKKLYKIYKNIMKQGSSGALIGSDKKEEANIAEVKYYIFYIMKHEYILCIIYHIFYIDITYYILNYILMYTILPYIILCIQNIFFLAKA